MPKKITFEADDDVHSFLVGYMKKQNLDYVKDAINQIIRERAKEPITSDVPMGMTENPEKQKAIQELKEEAIKPLPLPPCHYVGEGYIDKKRNIQMVYCRHPKKYKKPEAIPFSICYSCWQAKEWGKKKREQEQEEKPIEAEPEEDFYPQCSNMHKKYTRLESDKLRGFPVGTKLIYCTDGGFWKTLEQCQKCHEGKGYVKGSNRLMYITKEPSAFTLRLRELAKKRGFTGFSHYKCFRGNDNLKGETNFVYEDIRELMDKLPCLKDPTTDCIFTECRQTLMTKIKEEAPELIEILAKKTIATFKEVK